MYFLSKNNENETKVFSFFFFRTTKMVFARLFVLSLTDQQAIARCLLGSCQHSTKNLTFLSGTRPRYIALTFFGITGNFFMTWMWDLDNWCELQS